MLNTLEFILQIIFFVLSIIWAGKIMILRSDEQIVINPLLIIISSTLVMLSEALKFKEVFGINIEIIKIVLYSIYSLIILIGIYVTTKKSDIFNKYMKK